MLEGFFIHVYVGNNYLLCVMFNFHVGGIFYYKNIESQTNSLFLFKFRLCWFVVELGHSHGNYPISVVVGNFVYKMPVIQYNFTSYTNLIQIE